MVLSPGYSLESPEEHFWNSNIWTPALGKWIRISGNWTRASVFSILSSLVIPMCSWSWPCTPDLEQDILQSLKKHTFSHCSLSSHCKVHQVHTWWFIPESQLRGSSPEFLDVQYSLLASPHSTPLHLRKVNNPSSYRKYRYEKSQPEVNVDTTGSRQQRQKEHGSLVNWIIISINPEA